MFNRVSVVFFFAIASLSVLAACGGGGGGSTPAVPSLTATGAPGAFKGPMANASFSIKMPVYAATPKPKANARKTKNSGIPSCGECSPSIVFTVNGTAAATVNLTNGTGGLYFITIPLPIGTDAIVADVYDSNNGTGTRIATGSTSATIAVNAANTVNLTINGIVSRVCVYDGNQLGDTSNPPILAGSTGSRTLYLYGQDPDHDILYSAPLPSVTLTAAGAAASHVVFTPATTAAGDSSFSVAWDGLAAGDAALDTSKTCGTPLTMHFGGPYLYVANQITSQSTIEIFDQNNNSVANNASSAQGYLYTINDYIESPGAMVFDGQTSPKKLFVADFAGGRVLVYNAETNVYMATLGTTLRPWGLSLSSDGTKLFVAVSGSQDKVEIFDATNPALGQIGGAPNAPNSLMADGSFLNGLTTFMDPSLGQDVTVVSARYPQQSSSLYPSLVTLTGDTPVNYDANVLPTPGPLAAPGYATAYSSHGTGARGSLLVRENGGTKGVEWIDLNTSQVQSVNYTGGAVPDQYVPGPNALAVDSTGMNALAVGSTNAVLRFHWNSTAWQFTSCLSLGTPNCTINGDPYDPVGVVYSTDQTAAYVANFGDATISVLDARCGNPSFAYELGVGPNPFSMAVGTGGIPSTVPTGCP